MAELIGFWNFEEGTGSTTKDRTGYENDGTLEGTMTFDDWVQGVNNIDLALEFDGIDDRVDCGNSAPLDDIGNGSFSISFWMKSEDSVPLSNGTMISKYQDADNRFTIQSFAIANQLRVVFEKTTILATGNFNASPFDTIWHHIVIIIDRINDLMYAYMDSIKDTVEGDLSSLPDDSSNTGNLSIGAIHDGTQPYEGIIDEVRIYSGILTTNEIRFLYFNPDNKRVTDYLIKKDLIGLWRFDKGQELIAYDRSGYNNHGTLTNMSSSTDWVDGISNDALDFDGIDDRIECGDGSGTPLEELGNGSFSISFWINTTKSSNSDYIISKYEDADNRIIIYTFAAGQNPALVIEKSTNQATIGFEFEPAINDGYWHHIVIIIDRIHNTLYGYQDGIKINHLYHMGSVTADASNIGDLRFAGRSGQDHFDGILDEIRIYKKVLSKKEVNYLYRSPSVEILSHMDEQIQEGLIGLWRLNETSSLTADDESGYNNDGTLEGTMTDADWVSGIDENGLDFDGIDDRVDCGNSFPLNNIGESDFSISLWIKLSSYTGSRIIFSKWEDINNFIAILNDSPGGDNLRLTIAKSGVYKHCTFYSITPFDNEWHHIIFTVNRTTDLCKCYYDGIKEVQEDDLSTVVDNVSNNGNVAFGAVNDGTYPIIGLIDEVRIYNRELSNEEALFLYLNPNGLEIFDDFKAPDGIQLYIKSPTNELLGILSDKNITGNILDAQIEVLKFGGVDKLKFKIARNLDIPITLDSECYFYINSVLSLSGFIKEEPNRDQNEPILIMEGNGFYHKLKRIIVNETYTSETLNTIACDICIKYLGTEIGIIFNPYKINVPTALSSNTINFEDRNLLDCFKRILELCNYLYTTTKYIMYIDNEKELVIGPLNTNPITTLFEGYDYFIPEVSIDNTKIINKILAYRANSVTSDQIDYVATYQDTDSQGRNGVFQEKIIFPDYLGTNQVEDICDFILARKAFPITKVKIADYEFNSILEFGDYILSNRRQLYWRIIADCDSLTDWAVGGLTTATAEISSDHILTGKKSIKITTTTGSADEYIEFTTSDILYLPQIVRVFIFCEDATPELEIRYYDDGSNEVAIDIGSADLFNNQWLRFTDVMGQTTEEDTMEVVEVATPDDFEVNIDVSTTDILGVRKELTPGLLNIQKIRITIKSSTETVFYIDRLDCHVDIFNFHKLQIEQIKYNLSAVGLFADINFGEKEDSIIDEIKGKVDENNMALQIFAKQ